MANSYVLCSGYKFYSGNGKLSNTLLGARHFPTFREALTAAENEFPTKDGARVDILECVAYVVLPAKKRVYIDRYSWTTKEEGA